ncbi:MAG TPA: aldehyde dehydrogenase [Candidatus Anaerotignum merdipullorum]|nr:aldehyde dehydrogenase [Candidatus Anaerotignum merdipullorum]
MQNKSIEQIVRKQQAFFSTGKTHSLAFRRTALRRLRQTILQHTEEIYDALFADLGKSPTESHLSEIGLCLSELSYMLRHLRQFSRPRRVPASLPQFPAKAFVLPVPYGVTLILSPWNYPFLLTVEPLIDTLAAGNTAVLKPSPYAPHTSALLAKLLHTCFPSSYVAVIPGGWEVSQALLHQPFDHIFFTGSPSVGKEVMRHAAEHLTPVTLELGGKSPCIVDETADCRTAAKKIVFGKFLNCGQTCVAPDYIYCHKSQTEHLIQALKQEIQRQFGKDPLQNPHYGKIIHAKHFERLCRFLQPEQIIWGGQTDKASLRIAPTLLYPVSWEDTIMQEEIFGPLLPILSYTHLEEVLHIIEQHPHPLALYLFSQNPRTTHRVFRYCRFGGGCINDTLLHLASSHMGFGGVGTSGMGAYHGKAGFDTFSHQKSILVQRTHPQISLRYPPYSRLTQLFIRYFFR